MNALLLRYRFRLLFFSTVLFTAILGLPSSTKPRVLGSLLLLVLAGMNTLRRRSPLVYLTAFFGLFSLALYTTADFSSPYSSLPPGLLRGLSLILLYLTLFAALFRRVTQERPVTHELLYGLCALYLQMALAFALAYYMVEQMQPASFIASHGALGLDTFVYYSLVPGDPDHRGLRRHPGDQPAGAPAGRQRRSDRGPVHRPRRGPQPDPDERQRGGLIIKLG
ncbi:hypothetical protein [Pseudomonas aeruginosa]|nr:hypothetical protein [Pseudomonas aeruginosa]